MHRWPGRRRPGRTSTSSSPTAGSRRVERARSDPVRPSPMTSTARAGPLLPGLIDAHAHYTFDPTDGSLQSIARRSDEDILATAREHAALALRAGVTTARGAGSIRNLEVDLRDEIAAGTTFRARGSSRPARRSGAIDGHGAAFGLEASGPDGLAAATRQVIDDGADVVKVVASEAAMLTTTGHEPGRMVHGRPELDEDELRAIVETAAERGRRVMSHAQDRRVGAALGRGRRAPASSMPGWPTRPRSRRSPPSGAWLVPTLVVTDVNRTLPGLTPVQRERQDLIERTHRASTEAAIRLGVPLATGTDTGEVGRDGGHGLARDRLAPRPRRVADALRSRPPRRRRRGCSASTPRSARSRPAGPPTSCSSRATRWPTWRAWPGRSSSSRAAGWSGRDQRLSRSPTVGLGTAPADELLGGEASVVVDEVAAVRRVMRRQDRGLPVVAADADHEHRPAVADRRLVPGQVGQLVHDRERDDPPGARDDAVRGARPVEPSRALLAAQHRHVARRDAGRGDRGGRLRRPRSGRGRRPASGRSDSR